MTVYWLDPWSTSNGSGTYASPYSPSSSTRPNYSSGDELRIKSKLITDILDSGTETVTLGRVVTSGAVTYKYRDYIKLPLVQSLTYNLYDVIYFPSYGTFAKIVATFNDGTYDYIRLNGWGAPVPLNDETTTFTIQKVNSAYFNLSTNQTIYISEFNRFNGVNLTVSDGWTSETVQTTDGTAVSLFCTAYTSYTTYLDITRNFYHTTTAEYPPDPQNYGTLTCNMGNSVILCSSDFDTGSRINLRFIAGGSLTLRHADFGGVVSDAGPIVNVAPEMLDFTLTLDSVCAIGGVSVGGSYYDSWYYDPSTPIAEYTVDLGTHYGSHPPTASSSSSGHAQMGKQASKFSNLTYSFDKSYSTFINSINVIQVVGHNDVTLNVGPMYVLSEAYILPTNLNVTWSSVVINGNLTVNYSTSPAWVMEDSGGNTLSQVYWKSSMEFGSTYQTPVDNMAKHVIADLPPGVTASYNFRRIYYLPDLKLMVNRRGMGQVAGQPLKGTLRLPEVSFSEVLGTSSFDGTIYAMTNLIMSDGSYSTADSVRGTQTVSVIDFNKIPWLMLDATTIRTDGPSLKMQGGTAYDGAKASSGGGHRITFGVISGTTYSISGYVRTDRSGMATGDSVVGLYDENGKKISTAIQTSSAYNAWEQFTFSATASRDGEMSIFWYCEFDTVNQNYWLDDLEISA